MGEITVIAGGDPEHASGDERHAGDQVGPAKRDEENAEAEEVAKGVLSVARGEIAMNPAVASTVVHQWRGLRDQPLRLGQRAAPVLTPRELDVLAAMADGLSGKAIAARLGVALKTVENHKIRVFDKLGVRNSAELVRYAMRKRLVE